MTQNSHLQFTSPERILIIDDTQQIHEDFRQILSAPAENHTDELSSLEAELFSDGSAPPGE